MILKPPTRTSLNEDGTLRYTPKNNFNGTDTFTYQVCDSTGCTSQTVTVTVDVNSINDVPVAKDQEDLSTKEDTPLEGTLAAIDEDSDATRRFSIVSQPTNGTIELDPDTGKFTYTPETNYQGPDEFTFKANDGTTDSNTAKVRITVTSVNDEPTAKDDEARTDEDKPVDVDVLANDTDTDEGDKLSIKTFAQPKNGTVTRNGNGTLRYTPNANFNGTDTFEYTISDGNEGTDTAKVTVEVGAVNDGSVSKADRYQVKEGRTLQVRAPGVLGNDADTDLDSLSAEQVSQPKHDRLELRENGSFAYRADRGFRGSDGFSYRACDAGGVCSRPVTVTIKVLSDRQDEYGSIKKGHRNVGQGGGNR